MWRIWANRNTSDVYIASRTIAEVQKFSLHESGDWRYGFTSSFASAVSDSALTERIIDRWSRPAPDAGGWTPGVTIWVRAEDVTPVDDSELRGDIVWLAAPHAGQITGIHAVFIIPDQGFVGIAGVTIANVLALSNGHGLAVLASARRTENSEIEMLALERARAVGLMPPELSAREGEQGLRLGLFGNDANGARTVWDTAF